MKVKKILFAMFALVCVMAVSVSLVSCSSSDDEGTVTYNMGFDSVSYSGPDASFSDEIAMIDNTFKKELGVTTNQFTDYPGGDEALKTKCEKAGAILNSQADQIKGTYVYSVSKYSSKGSTTIYSWGNLK